jgi:hypothetical protein
MKYKFYIQTQVHENDGFIIFIYQKRTHDSQGRANVGIQCHNLNNLIRDPLDDVSCQISMLLQLSFQIIILSKLLLTDQEFHDPR